MFREECLVTDVLRLLLYRVSSDGGIAGGCLWCGQVANHLFPAV